MNNILDKIDDFLNTQKESEQKLFFILPILFFGFIVYYFIYPITNQMLENETKQQLNNQIEKKYSDIRKIKNDIVQVKKAQVKLEKEKKELDEMKIKMETLKSKLKFLTFDSSQKAQIYNIISNYIKTNHLSLLNLENRSFIAKDNGLIKLKMQMELTIKGKFPDVVRFIYKLESRKELIKVISFETDGVVSFVKINIYGAKL